MNGKSLFGLLLAVMALSFSACGIFDGDKSNNTSSLACDSNTQLSTGWGGAAPTWDSTYNVNGVAVSGVTVATGSSSSITIPANFYSTTATSISSQFGTVPAYALTGVVNSIIVQKKMNISGSTTYGEVFMLTVPSAGTATLNVTSVNSSGGVTGVDIASGGSGYSQGDLLSIDKGSAVGDATVQVTSVSSGGVITAVSITSAGTGYSVTIAATHRTTGANTAKFNITSVDGSGGVTGVTIASGGSGYALNETLSIDKGSAVGNATVQITSVSGGVITAVSITSAGSGYSVAIAAPTRWAINSPYNHGSVPNGTQVHYATLPVLTAGDYRVLALGADAKKWGCRNFTVQ